MTGPSASGSENGTPSSTRSAPESAYASATANEVSMSGNPPIMYGMSAARPSRRARSNAPLMSSAPGASISAIELAEARHRLRQVLVPPAAQTHDVVAVSGIGRAGGAEEPRDGVRRLERGQNALQPRELAEGTERFRVGPRLVARPAGIP